MKGWVGARFLPGVVEKGFDPLTALLVIFVYIGPVGSVFEFRHVSVVVPIRFCEVYDSDVPTC